MVKSISISSQAESGTSYGNSISRIVLVMSNAALSKDKLETYTEKPFNKT